MRKPLRLVLAALPLAVFLRGQAPLLSPQSAVPSRDAVLEQLLQEVLDRNPELQRNRSLLDADRERIPQARALPDPSLTLGLQNDGFKGLQVGKMETSYYQVMATQPLPWPGKRNLRSEIASLGAETTSSVLDRTRLSLIADLKRAYFGLLLVRGQLELLDEQGLFWQKAADITKVRYEVGQGSQADLLRAQLEQNRLRQSRFALRSEEKALLATLNRLRGIPPGTPLATTVHLAEVEVQGTPASDWLARAEQESPELKAARLGVRQAERSLDLAKRDRYPDFAVTAGLMPRGGLDPMWQVGFSISLPIWSKQKQQRAVSEQEYRRRASGSETQNVQNLLAQRIQERTAQFEAARETLRLYQSGLLVQSEASFQANLAQYEAGRAPFLSVLEALNGWVADRGGYLQAVAQAEAVQIAQEEFNLSATPPISAQALGSSGMGMGGSPTSAPSPSKSGASASKGESGAPAMKSM